MATTKKAPPPQPAIIPDANTAPSSTISSSNFYIYFITEQNIKEPNQNRKPKSYNPKKIQQLIIMQVMKMLIMIYNYVSKKAVVLKKFCKHRA
jgi:hypothetical protein